MKHPSSFRRLTVISSTVSLLVLFVAFTLFGRSQRNEVSLKSKSKVSKAILLKHIDLLKSRLSNATKEIKQLKEDLMKCKKGTSLALSGEKRSTKDASKSPGNGKRELKFDEAQQAQYEQYLLDFKINDEDKRNDWPWLDDSLYFGKSGGANRIQYSPADAAIDAGQAEDYGRGKEVTFDDLDRSFSDPTYYSGH